MSSSLNDTQRGRFRFRVAEYADGTPWIMTDPLWPQDRLKILGQGFVGFDLKPGTSYEQAEKIAHFMNEHIEYITATL